MWNESADVIIVGSGFAGLSAAIEARKAGASVLIMEKMGGYGGNSVISDGVMAAAGTEMQKQAGISDSPELMFEDMMRAGLGLNHPDLVQTVTESSKETFEWTIDYLGVRYKTRVDQFGGHSVPRSYTTHNRSGSAIMKALLAKVRELGMDVRTRMLLKNILKDAAGKITGVRVRDGFRYPDTESGRDIQIQAKSAVVLASGGFAADISFRSVQDPRLTEKIGITTKPYSTAEALKEALRIGATPVHLSRIQLGPWASADEQGYGIGSDFSGYVAFPYGIMVHPDTGRRFINELADRKIRADAILKIGRPCIAIADETGVRVSGQGIDHCLKKGVVKSFNTLKDLADCYQFPLAPLEKTIKNFNRSVENGKDEAFGKPILKGAKPLTKPPYFGIRLWPKVHYTMGGVNIDNNSRVLDLDNRPIKGLFAAGEVTGGVHGACRLGSCAITECLIFGRIAGRNASLLREGAIFA
jgi:flavocytochrome c